jgi:hypothetical protein
VEGNADTLDISGTPKCNHFEEGRQSLSCLDDNDLEAPYVNEIQKKKMMIK